MCKWMKRTLTLTLTLALCIGLAPASTVAASPDAPSATWNISLNASASVTASLYQIGDTPTAYRLDVSGTGATANYLGQDQPWSTYNRTITEVAVGEGIVYLGTGLFANMTALQTVTIAEGVGEIATQAFKGCSALTSVTLPQSLGVIRSYAFYECTALPEITIPAGVAQIENKAFGNCYALTKITFEQLAESNLFLTNGAFYTQYAVDTTVTTKHQAPQDYNWAGDNRTVTFGGSSEGPVVPPEGIPCSVPFGTNTTIFDIGGWYVAWDQLNTTDGLSFTRQYRSSDLINWSLIRDYSQYPSDHFSPPVIVGDGTCIIHHDNTGPIVYGDYSETIRVFPNGDIVTLDFDSDHPFFTSPFYFNNQYIIFDRTRTNLYAYDDFNRAIYTAAGKQPFDPSDLFYQSSPEDEYTPYMFYVKNGIAFLQLMKFEYVGYNKPTEYQILINTGSSDWINSGIFLNPSSDYSTECAISYTNNNYYLSSPVPPPYGDYSFVNGYYYSNDLISWHWNTLSEPYVLLNYNGNTQGPSTDYAYGLKYTLTYDNSPGFELNELIKIDGSSVTSLWTLPEGTLGHFVNSGDPYIIIRNGDGTGLLYKCSDFTA